MKILVADIIIVVNKISLILKHLPNALLLTAWTYFTTTIFPTNLNLVSLVLFVIVVYPWEVSDFDWSSEVY